MAMTNFGTNDPLAVTSEPEQLAPRSSRPPLQRTAGRTVTNRFETFRCQACGRGVKRKSRQQKFCSDRCRDFARRERDASQINARTANKNSVGYQGSGQPTNPLETPIAARRAIAEDFGRGREGYAKASKLIAEIERKHPAVANQFGSGAGLWLMRKDSEITENVLTGLLRGGAFALPIHDSYLVPRQIAEKTREIMAEALAKATRKPTRVSMAISSAQVPHKTAKSTTSLLQNGPCLRGTLPPGWVAWLSPGLASMVVLSWFYAGMSELERAA